MRISVPAIPQTDQRARADQAWRKEAGSRQGNEEGNGNQFKGVDAVNGYVCDCGEIGVVSLSGD